MHLHNGMFQMKSNRKQSSEIWPTSARIALGSLENGRRTKTASTHRILKEEFTMSTKMATLSMSATCSMVKGVAGVAKSLSRTESTEKLSKVTGNKTGLCLRIAHTLKEKRSKESLFTIIMRPMLSTSKQFFSKPWSSTSFTEISKLQLSLPTTLRMDSWTRTLTSLIGNLQNKIQVISRSEKFVTQKTSVLYWWMSTNSTRNKVPIASSNTLVNTQGL